MSAVGKKPILIEVISKSISLKKEAEESQKNLQEAQKNAQVAETKALRGKVLLDRLNQCDQRHRGVSPLADMAQGLYKNSQQSISTSIYMRHQSKLANFSSELERLIQRPSNLDPKIIKEIENIIVMINDRDTHLSGQDMDERARTDAYWNLLQETKRAVNLILTENCPTLKRAAKNLTK